MEAAEPKQLLPEQREDMLSYMLLDGVLLTPWTLLAVGLDANWRFCEAALSNITLEGGFAVYVSILFQVVVLMCCMDILQASSLQPLLAFH